jgi:hypothetical protein
VPATTLPNAGDLVVLERRLVTGQQPYRGRIAIDPGANDRYELRRDVGVRRLLRSCVALASDAAIERNARSGGRQDVASANRQKEQRQPERRGRCDHAMATVQHVPREAVPPDGSERPFAESRILAFKRRPLGRKAERYSRSSTSFVAG